MKPPHKQQQEHNKIIPLFKPQGEKNKDHREVHYADLNSTQGDATHTTDHGRQHHQYHLTYHRTTITCESIYHLL